MRRLTCAIVIATALAGCEKKAAKVPSPTAQRLEEYTKPLPTDDNQAIALLTSRLLSAVRLERGMLVIQDKGMFGEVLETFVVPASQPWAVSCGVGGVFVEFGTTGDGDGSRSGPNVDLHSSPVMDAGKCAVYGAAIGQSLQSLTGRLN